MNQLTKDSLTSMIEEENYLRDYILQILNIAFDENQGSEFFK
jgi:hypothetical protein